MVFAADERGQSVLVGTILLFGILIIAFSSYQAFVVPNQNAEVEFNHNSEAQSDMQDLRNSLTDIRSVRRGSIVSEHRSVRIQMGTSYPSRLIALNPPRPSGTLTTVEPNSEVEIRDATIENEDDFQEDADLDEIFESHPTTFLSYRPNYNEYGNAPNTNLEHSLLYNDFGDRTLTVADQNVVSADSNQITLILYDGDFTRSSSQSQTLAPRTVDGPTDPVELEPDNDELRLALPTNARERWEASLEDIDHATVNDGESGDDAVVLDLDVGELEDDSYKLRMARVSFDGHGTGQPEVFTPMQYEEQVADPTQPQQGNALEVDDGTQEEPPTAVQLEGHQGNRHAAAEFHLVNTDPGEDVTELESISFTTTNERVDRIERDSTAGGFDYAVNVEGEARIEQDPITPSTFYDFSGTADIEADSGTARIRMNEFLRQEGADQSADMRDETVTIEIEYRQGGQLYQQELDAELTQNDDRT